MPASGFQRTPPSIMSPRPGRDDLSGGGDGATPPEGMRAMHDAVANSRYVEFDPAAHISKLEQPEAFNDALKSFLAENTGYGGTS